MFVCLCVGDNVRPYFYVYPFIPTLPCVDLQLSSSAKKHLKEKKKFVLREKKPELLFSTHTHMFTCVRPPFGDIFFGNNDVTQKQFKWKILKSLISFYPNSITPTLKCWVFSIQIVFSQFISSRMLSNFVTFCQNTKMCYVSSSVNMSFQYELKL